MDDEGSFFETGVAGAGEAGSRAAEAGSGGPGGGSAALPNMARERNQQPAQMRRLFSRGPMAGGG